ncbi:hypothetical protein MMC31_006624 [Peltigera leucophlebia]|nr:hypothetical protein [Peltigera leucophlebia]
MKGYLVLDEVALPTLSKPHMAESHLDKIEAVTILDTCQVGIATRSSSQTERAAEVVSAVRANQNSVLGAESDNLNLETSKRSSSEAWTDPRFYEFSGVPRVQAVDFDNPYRVHLLPLSSILTHQPEKHLKEQSSHIKVLTQDGSQ